MTSPQYLIYVGGYAAAHEPGIRAFHCNATGELTVAWSFAGITNPSFLAVHPNGKWLYAVSEMSQQENGRAGEVWALSLPAPASAPQALNHQESGGDLPCHLLIDATGRWLLVSNYGSGSVAVLPIQENGALGAMTQHIQHHGSGPRRDRQAGPHAHSTILTPDNRFAIVADLGIDQLVIYAFDAAGGKLNPHGHVATRPGAGPRHMAFHPNGRYFYVIHELDSSVVVYDYHAEGCELTERQRVETRVPGATAAENLAAELAFAPGGEQFYVSNRGDNNLVVFAVAADGQLERLSSQTCGGSWPRNFAVAPDGQFLLVANQYSNDVTTLPALDGGKRLDQPRSKVALPGAAYVQFVAS